MDGSSKGHKAVQEIIFITCFNMYDCFHIFILQHVTKLEEFFKRLRNPFLCHPFLSIKYKYLEIFIYFVADISWCINSVKV